MKPAMKSRKRTLQRARKHGGYISLMSVIILGAVGIAVSTSIIVLGLGASQSSFAYDQSNRARAAAEACAEEGLERIRESSSYAGSGNISLDSDECSYLVENLGGSSRRISASGNIGSIVRRVVVETSTRNPRILIDSWREVAD